MLLNPKRILFIGMPAGAIPVRRSKFFAGFDINDFELVAWDAKSFVAETQEKTGQPFQSYHHPFVYRRFKELYEQTIITILNWIRHGHVFVVFPYLHDKQMEIDGANKRDQIDINQFPPFNLINITPAPEISLRAAGEFHAQFSAFTNIFKSDLLLMSGEDIVPLFRTSTNHRERSTIAGAAFRVGKGAIVFSPRPDAWDNPKLLEYFDALAKLPDMLGRPVDPLPETTRLLQQPVLWLATLTGLIIATIALSPFWVPHLAQLPPWARRPPAAEQGYGAPAARLAEIEKHPSRLTFHADAIKSAESALARGIDQLEPALSAPQELPEAPPITPAVTTPSAPRAPTPPAGSSPLVTEQPAAPLQSVANLHLSVQEIAGLLARGETLLREGDVASARLFFERAANAGEGQAALRLGATFDPAFLGRGVLGGAHGDATEAHFWYQRARDLGEAEAEQRFKGFKTK